MPAAQRTLVLLIEDDQTVQKVTTRILESFGYEVDSAEDIAGAVDLVGRRGAESACVLVDYSLKSGTGIEAIEQMHRIDAGLPMIMLSGFPQADIETNAGRTSWAGFLQKPYSAPELRSTLEMYRRA